MTTRGSRNGFSLIRLMIVAAFAACAAQEAGAQVGTPGRGSYITPFPETERYQAIVIGDGLAQGLASGLQEAFRQDGSVRILDFSKYSAGLIRSSLDMTDDVDAIMKTTKAQIAIVMVGVNDARSIRTSGSGRARLGTNEWRDAYGNEAVRLIKKLKSHDMAIYWLGMPVMSNAQTNEAMETINEVLREKTYLNGVRFIDTWSGFTDQFGAYSAFGPDLTGQTKRLRENDGIYFTAAGNRKLAHYAEVVIRRDLATARQQRNIPLAGSEEEQSRLIPRQRDDQQSKPGGPEPGMDGELKPAKAFEGVPSEPRIVVAPVSDSAAFSPSAVSPGGEIIAGDIGSGVTALASISPANDLSLRYSQGRIPTSDRLYNKVLIKGEYLPPRKGRVDDYSWPAGSPAEQSSE